MASPAQKKPRLSMNREKVAASPLTEETIEALNSRLEKDEQKRNAIGEAARALNKSISLVKHELAYGAMEAATRQWKEVKNEISTLPETFLVKAPDRDGRVSELCTQLVTVDAYIHFMEEQRLRRKADLPDFVELNEYISGIIQMSSDLSSYALRRATVNDVDSIAVCRDMVFSLNEKLMEFNFRGGPLRKRYDGLKYSLKKLTDLLYEQSLLGEHPYADVGSANENAVDTEELDALRVEMEDFDEKRELVIRSTRGSAQKTAKQAIYSLQRGKLKIAEAQIKECEEAIKKTKAEYVDKYPALRIGAYSDCLEEYAEASIFYHWLSTKTVPGPDLFPLLNDDEYLGGLVDFTGEVGRYAVSQATKRNKEVVQQCFEADLAVTKLLLQIRSTRRAGRKADALYSNTKKVEQIMYELSLFSSGFSLKPKSLDESDHEEQPRGEE